jgi:hypothetical protein
MPKKIQNKPFFPNVNSRLKMVSWFSPIILLRTLQDLVLSKIVGSQVDTRELQSVNENIHGNEQQDLLCKIQNPYKNTQPDEDFYFDFIADTGDGWNSTYTVASLLSRDYLVFDDYKLPRGELLIMGGDEIYPGPSEQNYQQRLLNPFTHAWDWLWLKDSIDTTSQRETGSFISLDKTPDVYAIPGNHDWYDSLIAFRKLFCNIFKLNKLGQWQTNQARSYFAIGLPHKWVILGFDIGLDQYKLDGLQYHYFKNIIHSLDSDNRLILVAAEPQWSYGGVQKKKLNQAFLDFEALVNEVFHDKSQEPPKIYLNLAGDTHNYQRYETLKDKELENCIQTCANEFNCTQKQSQQMFQMSQNQHTRTQIVAGGGGAFLHPTHSTTQNNMRIIPDHRFSLGEHAKSPYKSEVEVKNMYALKCCYPNIETSKKLSNQLLFKFLPNNISLGIFMATVYLVLAWPMRSFLDSVIIEHQLNGFADSGLNFLTLLISILLITGYTLWAKKRPGLDLTLAGMVHGCLQALLLYGGYVLVYLLLSHIWQSYQLDYGWFLFPIARDSIYFILISIFAPLLLGLALWIYLNIFKTSQNDLFGSGSIENYKHLIRLKIDQQGRLTVYPIAIENVCAYSMPSHEETSSKHRQLLEKHNGKDWNKVLSNNPNKNHQLSPEVIKYHLIEEPIVIEANRNSANSNDDEF